MLARLSQLEPRFLRWEKHEDGHVFLPWAAGLHDAHGIFFLCPICFVANKGVVGTHGVICWFASKVPDDASPGPGRWNPTGTNFEDLSLSPSIQLLGGGCAWHGFVTNGEVT